MEADTPKQWPTAQIDTMITVVTFWIRSLLFQLTMADPVKGMLVTPPSEIFRYLISIVIYPYVS